MVTIDDESLEDLEKAFAEGRGIVVVTAHFGFYDLGVAFIGSRGWPFTAVGEVLRPRALFEWFARIRVERGMKIIPSRPGAEAMEASIETVRRGEAIALVCDRDLGRRGVPTVFFGEETTLPPGPGTVLTRTGAALVLAGVPKVGRGRYKMNFRRIPLPADLGSDEGASVVAITHIIAGELEQLVRTDPQQWHLFMPNWPSDDPRRA